MHERIVEQKQGLERRGAGETLRCAGRRISAVEDREIGMPLNTLSHQIDAALLCFVHRFEGIVLREFPLALRRERMPPAGGAVEAAAEQEQRVADGIGIETAARKRTQKLVIHVVR